jgi:hypothetical protein
MCIAALATTSCGARTRYLTLEITVVYRDVEQHRRQRMSQENLRELLEILAVVHPRQAANEKVNRLITAVRKELDERNVSTDKEDKK